MLPAALPSGRAFVLDLRLIEGALSVPAVAVLVFYLNGVLDFSLADWAVFTKSIAAYVLVLSVAGDFWRRRWWRRLVAWLDAPDGDARARLAGDAFAEAMALPRRFLAYHLGTWALAGAFGVVGMALFGQRSWGAFESFTTFFTGATGGVVAGALVFFGLRERLGRVREALALAVADPGDRAARVPRVSLRAKLMLTVASSGLASVVFAALLAYQSASTGVVRAIGDWQAQLLDAEATAATSAARGPVELVRFEPDVGRPPPAALGGAAAAIESRLGAGERAGTIRADGRIVSWRGLPDGAALVAVTRASSLDAFLRSVSLTLLGFLGLGLGVSALLVSLFARDLGQATQALSDSALQLARGDLRPGRVFESEDELGALARTYAGTCDALRALVADVSRSAARVDGAAGDLSSVSQRVADGAAEQTREMDLASASMEQIHAQVQSLSGAASRLRESTDEAGGSIAELGAAGEQLRDTAGTLSRDSDAVLGSVEEAVRASEGVAESSETLSAAATETSARMEQIASAMRVVNAAAERMADLVDGVRQSAELGRARVGETGRGMREIQRTTETAGRVVHRLVTAAKEIGTVLQVIDEVADETSLLAFNAAIIAAQSGEIGRAFAVVADHVRSLAERVLASTSRIEGLVGTLHDECAEAVSAIDHGMQSVGAGVLRAEEAGRSLDEIAAAVAESGDFTRQIVGAVAEQTQATGHVVDSMAQVLGGVERIRAAEQERARANERITAAVSGMRDVARQVRNTTEEQARGHARIHETSGRVRATGEHMDAALQEQASACAEVAGFLERVLARTRESGGDARRMADAVQRLVREAEQLRDGTRRFEL